MKRLYEYLDANGWTTTRANTRRIEKDGWIYDWQAGSWSDLWRWPVGHSSDHDIEQFVIRDEDKALQIANDIAAGIHMDSPIRDPNTWKKIRHIE